MKLNSDYPALEESEQMIRESAMKVDLVNLGIIFCSTLIRN